MTEIRTIQDAIKDSVRKQRKRKTDKAYYERNRERLIKRVQDYYKENIESRTEYHASRYQEKKTELYAKSRYWNQIHRKESNMMKRKYATLNRSAIAIAKGRRAILMRLELFELLGGTRCVQCGYDKDFRALCFDHIRDDGGEDRRMHYSSYGLYRFYINNPDVARANLQVLCSNCNNIKKYDYMGFSKESYLLNTK